MVVVSRDVMFDKLAMVHKLPLGASGKTEQQNQNMKWS